jgi:hypothetical protein
MKRLSAMFLMMAASGVGCLAQQWEFGGLGGGGFLSNVNVSAPAGTAKAGFQAGLAAGAFVGQNLYSHLAGEIRYEFLQNNLRISSSGQTVTFSGNAHAVHYDLIWHTNRKESRTQFFVAAGGGIKVFRGTGAPQSYQPLYQFGLMTHTQQVKPMGVVGAGVRFTLSHHMFLRTEFRDFITPFPTDVITPPSSSVKYGSILHDFVPMVGISYEF